MKERLITLGGALIAAFIIYSLMFPHKVPEQQAVSLPTTEDRGEYGLAGLKAWLDKSGIATLSLRKRYHELHENPDLNGSGNLMIVSLPMRLHMRELESQQLTTWLEQGNHILVLAAMSDWPEWALRQRSDSVTQFFSLLGIHLSSATAPTEDSEQATQQDTQKNISGEQAEKKPPETIKPEDKPVAETDQPQEKPSDKSSRNTRERIAEVSENIQKTLNAKKIQQTLVPVGQHPVTATIKAVDVTRLESEGQGWELSGSDSRRSGLIVLKNQQDNSAAMWQIRVGQGSAWISSHADIFGNVSLGRADNAGLIANMVNYSLGGDGVVVFDDVHQGLTAMYDPDAFFKDSRLHNTIWFIILLWLVYALGYSNRFHPVRTRTRHLHLVDHVKAFGGLFARRLHTSAVARRIFMFFFNEIRLIHALPQNGRQVWHELEQNSAVNKDDLLRLRQLHERAENGQRVNLKQISNTINAIRKQLL